MCIKIQNKNVNFSKKIEKCKFHFLCGKKTEQQKIHIVVNRDFHSST
jgi:hypothetical protein